MTKNIVNKAFSLIDFAIWITIFSVMVIGFLAISSAQNKHKNFVADNLEKQLIQNKINSYVLKEISNSISNSNIILHKSCDNAGLSTPNPCSVESDVRNITQDITDSTIRDNIGYVPYKTLGLNQEDAIDSNNKFYMFLAYRIDSKSQYQYYVFSQTEEAIDIQKIIDNENVKNQNQNTIIPTQIPNCHIAVTISKTASQTTTNDYIDILSGSLKQEIDCQKYNILSNNIIYKNNANPALPSNDKINFECFSGNDDYTPQNQKCERVCTTFSAGGTTYNIEPAFFNGLQTINPAGSDNSTPSKPYSNLYDSLKISKSLGSILQLRCNVGYIYEIDSIQNSKPCQTNYELSADRKSCQYTCAIDSNSIGVGSNTARYLNGTTYQQIINDTVCISNTKSKASTLSNQAIACTEANPTVTLTSGSDTYQICQCDSDQYYVKKGAANECVRGCKMSLDVVGPGTLANRDKLYYQGQSVADVFADIKQCNDNASKNTTFFTTEKVYRHVSNQNYCILRKQLSSTIWAVENFRQKLCTCNSNYSLLAENSISNYNGAGYIFYNFPGTGQVYAYSARNFDAKYDCFLMCSATTVATDSRRNVANASGNLTDVAIGYHKNNLTERQLNIINSLNAVNFKEYGNPLTTIKYLFYDGTNQKQLQPLDCPTTGSVTNYCLRTDLSGGKRLFSTQCTTHNDSLPFLQIKSGGLF